MNQGYAYKDQEYTWFVPFKIQPLALNLYRWFLIHFESFLSQINTNVSLSMSTSNKLEYLFIRITLLLFIYQIDPISNSEHKIMDENEQYIVKLDLGSCSCQVQDFEKIPCAHIFTILRMLNLDIQSYIAEFYYRETQSAGYSGCV